MTYSWGALQVFFFSLLSLFSNPDSYIYAASFIWVAIKNGMQISAVLCLKILNKKSEIIITVKSRKDLWEKGVDFLFWELQEHLMMSRNIKEKIRNNDCWQIQWKFMRERSRFSSSLSSPPSSSSKII